MSESRGIFVIGMHRSGTSALMGALAAMGLGVGLPEVLTGANEENPKGFFERRDARNICDSLLHSLGADWWKVSAFEVEHFPDRLFMQKASSISALFRRLNKLGHWALKEPRLCLLFPLFRCFVDSPVALISIRNPVEVAKSLQVRNGFPMTVGIALWEAYLVNALRHTRHVPRHFIFYEDLISYPERTLGDVAGWLFGLGVEGLQTNSGIRSIDPQLHRQSCAPSEADVWLPNQLAEFWAGLQQGTCPSADTRVSKHSLAVLSEFERGRLEYSKIGKKLAKLKKN